MTTKLAKLILVTVIGLILVACGSDSNDVPSLNTDDTQRVESTAAVEEEPLDDEAKMMAFVQCMRDEGIEFLDPTVDSEGNVQRPELAEGVAVSREEMGAAYEACSHHPEGLASWSSMI